MRVLVFSLLLFTLIGCAPSVKETKPTTVSPAVRIRVYSGGVEVGRWETNQYTYVGGWNQIDFVDIHSGKKIVVYGPVVIEEL